MLELLVFGGYVVLVLVIGRLTGRKIHSAEDYHLCGRNLGKWPASFSQAATEFSGSGLIGGAGIAYAVGLSGVWWNWSAAPVYIVVGFTIVYLLRKLRVGTTPGYLGDRYGETVRRLAGSFQVIGLVMFTGVQIKASMVTLSVLFGMDPNVSAVIVTTVFVAYTMMGGLWAVVWTDVLQYAILMGGLFLATGFAWINVGGVSGLTAALPERYFDPTAQGPMVLASYFLLVIISYSTDQMVIQRGLAARDPATARFAYVYTGINYLVFGACIVFLGMAAAVLLPGLPQQDDALPNLIDSVFPASLRSVFLTAILAVTMSTASSALAAASAMLVQDIYEPLTNRDHHKSERRVVRDSRIATLVVGVASLLLSVRFPNVVEMVFLSVGLANAPLFVPLLLALFWGKANPRSAPWAMVAVAVVTMLSSEFWYGRVDGLLGDLHYLVVGPLTGLAIMLGWTFVRPADR